MSFRLTPVCDSKNQFPPSAAEPVLSVDARTVTPVCVASVSTMYFQSGSEYRAHAIMSKCAAPISGAVLHHTMKSLNGPHVSRVGSCVSTRATMHDPDTDASMLNAGAL